MDPQVIEVDDMDDFREPARFAEPLTEEQIEKKVQESKPQNTRKNTAWGVAVYEAWRKQRNEKSGSTPEALFPSLLEGEVSAIDRSLAMFFQETRRKDGKPYPGHTLYQLACGLQRYMRENRQDALTFNLVDVRNPDPRFTRSRAALDARMKEVTSAGVGIMRKKADVLSVEDERTMWKKGALGTATGSQMMNTVFFYIGKLFGLRLDEQESLTFGQVTREMDGDGWYIRYRGGKNKTTDGGLSRRHVPFKDVRHRVEAINPVFPTQEEQEATGRSVEVVLSVADLVTVYKALVMSQVGADDNGRFYRRALPNGKLGEVRFSKQHVGRNTLAKIIPSMTSSAGLQGNYTSHSAKASLCTQLYDAKVDEQLIMERTGHRSVAAVRQYKRTTPALQKDVSRVLEPFNRGPREGDPPAAKKPVFEESAFDTATKSATAQPADDSKQSGKPTLDLGSMFRGGENAVIQFNFNFQK